MSSSIFIKYLKPEISISCFCEKDKTLSHLKNRIMEKTPEKEKLKKEGNKKQNFDFQDTLITAKTPSEILSDLKKIAKSAEKQKVVLDKVNQSKAKLFGKVSNKLNKDNSFNRKTKNYSGGRSFIILNSLILMMNSLLLGFTFYKIEKIQNSFEERSLNYEKSVKSVTPKVDILSSKLVETEEVSQASFATEVEIEDKKQQEQKLFMVKKPQELEITKPILVEKKPKKLTKPKKILKEKEPTLIKEKKIVVSKSKISNVQKEVKKNTQAKIEKSVVAEKAPISNLKPKEIVKLSQITRYKNDEVKVVNMILRNNKGETRKKSFLSYKLETDKGTKTLLKFLSPNDTKNSGTLTQEVFGKDDIQHLYLPASDKLRRIQSENKDQSWMGSDLNYEDLEELEVDRWNYQLLKNETLDGQLCYVIKMTPKSSSDSIYAYQKHWISQKNKTIHKIDLFDKNLKHIKTISMKKYKKNKDGFLQAWEIVAINIKDRHKTVLEVKKLTTNSKLSSAVLSTRYLQKSITTYSHPKKIWGSAWQKF